MKNYTLEQFTSHNTSFNRTINVRTKNEAIKKARNASSIIDFPVVLKDNKGAWIKYENCEMTEWSFQTLT